MHEVEGHRVFNPFYRAFLDATERDAWQKPEEVIRALALAPGSTVADVGAGTGYFTTRLAAAVGAGGRVYATDVQDAMILALEERVEREALRNVTVVRAGFDGPSLPEHCCDVVLLANVYKELSDGPPTCGGWLRRCATAAALRSWTSGPTPKAQAHRTKRASPKHRSSRSSPRQASPSPGATNSCPGSTSSSSRVRHEGGRRGAALASRSPPNKLQRSQPW